MNKLLSMLAAVCVCAGAAQAGYPDKPVSVVVPFPPGGASDAVGRLVSGKAGEKLGQSFIIDNKPGATGAIGAAAVKRAPADGYTMMVASIGVYAVNPFLQKNLAYDATKDFDLLTVLVRAPNVLVVNSRFPAQNLAEFIAYLKKNPDKVSFATSGSGSSDHLTTALFWQKSGTTGVHVPYKGGGPAIQDLLGGHADASFQNINAVLSQIQAGKLRVLAMSGDKRSPLLPEVPTLAEAGLPGVEVYSWQAAAAPKGLPADVKKKLHGALVAALNEPDVKKKLTDQGLEIVGNTPEQFQSFLLQELARWKAVVESARITLD